jgi:hypothetical protein
MQPADADAKAKADGRLLLASTRVKDENAKTMDNEGTH